MLSIHIASVGCLNLIAKRLGLIKQLPSELNDFPIIYSGFQAVDSGFQVLDSGSLDFRFQSLIGFEIPSFRIRLHGAIRLRSIKKKLLENCRHKETAARMDNTINDVHNSSYHF